MSLLFPIAPRNLKAHRGKAISVRDRAIMPKTPRQKNQSNGFLSKRTLSLLEIHHALSLFCTLRCLHKFSLYCFHSKHTVLHKQYSPAHEI